MRMGEEIARVQHAGGRGQVGRVPPDQAGSTGASSQGSDLTQTGPTQLTTDPSQVATVGRGSRASVAPTDASHCTSGPHSTVAHDGRSPITMATTRHTLRSGDPKTGTQSSKMTSSAVATAGHGGANHTRSGAGRGTGGTDFSTRASVGHGQCWHDRASMVLSPTSLSQASPQHSSGAVYRRGSVQPERLLDMGLQHSRASRKVRRPASIRSTARTATALPLKKTLGTHSCQMKLNSESSASPAIGKAPVRAQTEVVGSQTATM